MSDSPERTKVLARSLLVLLVGTPENSWFLDITHDPALTLEIEGRPRAYLAVPVPGAEARERIRALLREKYGFRDRWIGLLFDTSRSVAVRLDPADPQDPR